MVKKILASAALATMVGTVSAESSKPRVVGGDLQNENKNRVHAIVHTEKSASVDGNKLNITLEECLRARKEKIMPILVQFPNCAGHGIVNETLYSQKDN